MTNAPPKIIRECSACGTEFSTTAKRIEQGRGKYCSKSCAARVNQRKHGHSGKNWQSPTYNSWAGLVQRCTNPKHPKYPLYGGRGILLAHEWLNFEAFLNDMGERPDGKTIDRIDNDGPYSKDNCRWSTPKDQQNNQKRTRMVTYQGKSMSLSSLSELLGLRKNTLFYRIQNGWPESHWGQKAWAGNRHS